MVRRSGGLCLNKLLGRNLFLIAFVIVDFVCAAAPSLEENRKLQFQQFLNQNDRDDESTATKPLRSRPRSNNINNFNNAQDEPVKLRHLIESLLEVQCSRQNITVKLHYHPSYSRLTPGLVTALSHGTLYAGHHNNSNNNTVCLGKSDENLGEIVIALNYDNNCDLITERISNNTLLYSTSVTIEFGNSSSSAHLRDFRENYKVTCVCPETETTNEAHILKLSGQKNDEAFWNYPRDVERGSDVYLRGDVYLSGYNSSAFHSFPVNCWVAQSPSYVSEQHRRYFLSQGCPMNDHKGRGLARVHHMTDGRTKVGFTVVNSLLWPEHRQQIYVHCQLLSCVQSFTSGIVGVAKCPSATYCAGIPQLSHVLPEHLRGVALYSTVAGPLNIVEKREPPPPSVFSVPTGDLDLKCQLACAQTSLSQFDTVPQAAATLYVEGVSTKLVIAIAFSSFLIGMLMMGVLWFVHVRTDPKRKVQKLRTTTSNSSTSMNHLRFSPHANFTENNLQQQQTAKLMLNSS